VEESVRAVSIPIAVVMIAAAASLFGVVLGGYLQIRSTEHQIHYTKLHENRAEVVEHLYAQLYEADIAFKRWITPSGYDREEQMKVVAQRYNELVDYYFPHALWLEEESREKLEALIATMKRVFEDFRVLPDSGAPRHIQAWNEPPSEQIPKLRHEVTMKVLKEIPELRKQLLDEFQAILYPRRSVWARIEARVADELALVEARRREKLDEKRSH
jgi:hypothetical protein